MIEEFNCRRAHIRLGRLEIWWENTIPGQIFGYSGIYLNLNRKRIEFIYLTFGAFSGKIAELEYDFSLFGRNYNSSDCSNINYKF